MMFFNTLLNDNQQKISYSICVLLNAP